jgi:DNA anti-recombination protein RmuC
MPVTAKLSQRFYERFGDETANELVEWFNSVDATYRADLRDLNELNFARFDARLEQRVTQSGSRLELRIAEVETKLERRIVEVEVKLERRIAALEARLDQSITELRSEFHATLAKELGTLRAELIKWSFVFFATAALAVIGLR